MFWNYYFKGSSYELLVSSATLMIALTNSSASLSGVIICLQRADLKLFDSLKFPLEVARFSSSFNGRLTFSRGPPLLLFLSGILSCILTCLPRFVVLGRWYVHAFVHPIRFTPMEMEPCVILLVGATHCGTDILKEPLAELPGPTLSGIGGYNYWASSCAWNSRCPSSP